MSGNDLIFTASEAFYLTFKTYPTVCASAPGRVNLIGEHTDYNDGFVFPMALPLVTVIVGKRNNSKKCRLITSSQDVDNPKDTEFYIPDKDSDDEQLVPGKPSWANYVKGVMANFKGRLYGFDAVITTSVPVGGGLSSSAALEVATYLFLEALDGKASAVSLKDKALACQKAEHVFTGTPCGIMDQFISLMGKKDYALLLDCRSMEYELVKLENPEITILITNTNVHHNLAESQYAQRRKQCENAAKIIGKSSLRDVTMEDLQNYQNELGDETFQRVWHVVTEIRRTIEAAEALKAEDYVQFGKLMLESHQSLRDSYEVSCPELDEVVEYALETEGVFGSRMTGGGFGGCTVTLLKINAVQKTMQNIKEKYKKNPTFYVCRPGDGARIINIS